MISTSQRLLRWAGAALFVAVSVVPHHDARGQEDANPIVVLETSKGDIVLELRPDRAPNTVEHFLRLVRDGYYDEMLFHRVVNDILIQVGLLSMEGEVRGLEVEPVRNESRNRLTNRRGAVAMARESDPHSASTEFFINVRDNPEFDYVVSPRRRWGYAVFGRVIEGMEVVDDIARIPTKGLGPFPEFPSDPVAIYRAYERVSGEQEEVRSEKDNPREAGSRRVARMAPVCARGSAQSAAGTQ